MATRKIDWDNMTDEERASYNRTIDPQTHYKQHIEYPKYIYGRRGTQIVRMLVKSEDEEQAQRDGEPDAHWELSMRDHGLITCPSAEDAQALPTIVGVGSAPEPKSHEEQMAETVPLVYNIQHNDAPAAKAARRRGPAKHAPTA